MKITIEIPDGSLEQIREEQAYTAMADVPVERYLSACAAIGATILSASILKTQPMHRDIGRMVKNER